MEEREEERDDDGSSDDNSSDDESGGCSPPPTPPDGCIGAYASQVISYSPGTKKSGHPLPANVSDPTRALGVPEEDPNNDYVALGFGGSITLRFLNPISNVSGRDFEIFESVILKNRQSFFFNDLMTQIDSLYFRELRNVFLLPRLLR